MDPLTAALQLATTIAEIVKLTIEAQPMEVRAEYAKQALADFKAWRLFLAKLPGWPSGSGLPEV